MRWRSWPKGSTPTTASPGLENTGVITHPDWIPEGPVPLRQVALTLDSGGAHPVLTGGEPETAAVRPLATSGQPYRRYHDATRELAPPRLFENRCVSASLAWTDVSAATAGMEFGHMGFFDSVDINEALAH